MLNCLTTKTSNLITYLRINIVYKQKMTYHISSVERKNFKLVSTNGAVRYEKVYNRNRILEDIFEDMHDRVVLMTQRKKLYFGNL
jgi:hypothetical protein